MIHQQLSVFLKNEPGVLAQVCDTLAGVGVNILAMSVSDTVDHAVVRLVVDQPREALHLLGEHGMLVVETEVLGVKLANRPGVLAKVAHTLADAGVNIEYAYGSGLGDQSLLIIRASDLAKARTALADLGA